MNTKALSLILVLALFLAACEVVPDLEASLEGAKISVPTEYELLDFSYSWAIGEHVEQYDLLISKSDYERISNEIKNKPYFMSLGKDEDHLFAPRSGSKIGEVAYLKDGMYVYKIYIPNPGIIIGASVEEDSLMTVIHNNL